MIITIDGPSGTGKTTVAQKVASRLGISYFDTGAMYRAFTWVLLNDAVVLTDENQIRKQLQKFTFEIESHGLDKKYLANGVDVTKEIRSQKVTDRVSEVSAIFEVRKALWKMQRGYGEKQSAVFEGRDMGSVVFPKAEVKIFLDARPEVRARRRLAEMRLKQPLEANSFDEHGMEKELMRRDAHDSEREIAPLKCPKDALRIDTSEIEIDKVVEEIVKHHSVKAQKLLPSWLRSRSMKPLYRIVIFSAWTFLKIFYRHRIFGIEHCVKRAAIIAPNHTSYLDPPIVAVSWPEEVHFLAREGLFKPFLFGPFIRALNSHPVHGDVSDVSVFKTIIGLLKEGRQIILFPEGARTDGALEKIKPGIGMLVMRSQAAIIPTYIHGAYQAWDRHRKFPKLFGKTACVFGSPILWDSFAHLEKRQAQQEIANALRESIFGLKKWYEAGAKGTPP